MEKKIYRAHKTLSLIEIAARTGAPVKETQTALQAYFLLEGKYAELPFGNTVYQRMDETTLSAYKKNPIRYKALAERLGVPFLYMNCPF